MAGWRGSVWGTFDLSGLRPIDDGESLMVEDAATKVLVHLGISRAVKVCAHQDGVKDRSAGFVHTASEAKVSRAWKSEKAAFTLDAKDRRALPTLHHVIERLAEILVYECITAQVIEGTGAPGIFGASTL